MTTDNVFCFQAETPDVKIEDIFDIVVEGEDLRVKNKNVDLLYRKLRAELFDKYYNYFNKFIDFDFNPVIIGGTQYQLSKEEQSYLRQFTVTNSLYLYVVNQAKITLKPNRISLQVPFDTLLALLDKKYGVDTKASITVGASVLKLPVEDFLKKVKARRQYYNK